MTDYKASNRRSRRAKGLCGRQGCPETSGDKYYCELHRAEEAARAKLRRQKAAMRVAA